MPDFQEIPDRIARAKRPSDTGKIETELQVSLPRSMVWAAREWSHGSITPEMEEFLINGTASRAWTVRHETQHDREGTDHWVQYCFEAGKFGSGFLF